MDTSSRQKIIKETAALTEITDQMGLIDTCRTLHPNIAEYTFFSRAHGTFSKIDHMLGNKASLNKIKKLELSSYSLSIK